MKVIKILVSIILILISLIFSIGLVFLIINGVDFNKYSCLCIICYTALCGVSLGLLTVIVGGNETEKANLLSKEFEDVAKKIIPEEKSDTLIKNEFSNPDEKTHKICISCKQLETIDKCFKSYANAMADI